MLCSSLLRGALAVACVLCGPALLWGEEAGPEDADPAVGLRARVVAGQGRARIEPRLARWYDGQLEHHGRWLTVGEAQEAAAGDLKLLEYEDRRAQAERSLRGHQRLARWCEKNELPRLARVHWMHALRIAPEDKAALAALDLVWYDGILMTPEEKRRYREREKGFAAEQKRWRSRAKRIARRVLHDDPEVRAEAREELAAIDHPAAVPALVEELGESKQDAKKAGQAKDLLIRTLGRIESPEAVSALASFAAYDGDESTRYQATEQLKKLDKADVVPTLISALEMPVDISVATHLTDGRVVNDYTYIQEAPGGHTYRTGYSTSRSVPGPKFLARNLYETRKIREGYTIPESEKPGYWSRCGGYWVPAQTIPAKYVEPEYGPVYTGTVYSDNPYASGAQSATMARSRGDAARAAAKAETVNRGIAERNGAVAEVLTEVTGATLDAHPKSWWNWWGERLAANPGLANAATRQELNRALLNDSPRGLARGTLVWTLRGQRSVESLLPGDLILSQDPKTGELAYQPVLFLAPPREQAVSRYTLAGGDELHAAPGHIAWSAGRGWQRLAKLEPGHRLHAVGSEPSLAASNEAFTIESYDLIIDGSHSLFIGAAGVLVHDATPVAPTRFALPGIPGPERHEVVAANAGG
ncbi:MAG: hypothetical protein AAGA92_08820 [Planctomycetota bacterium]